MQAAVFAGKDKITFLDIQSFGGNLFDLIEKSEAYVKEHINWRADLSGSKRVEIPEIPVRAIKETIINSLCHRDFTNPKSNEIAIYRNRIEIYNPGQFPHDYSLEDFIKGNEPSIPRNPLIAETLYRSKDIEKWGRGISLILFKEPQTVFKEVGTHFIVTFKRKGVTAPTEPSAVATQKTTQKILELIRQKSYCAAPVPTKADTGKLLNAEILPFSRLLNQGRGKNPFRHQTAS